jgi:hypothetical protein
MKRANEQLINQVIREDPRSISGDSGIKRKSKLRHHSVVIALIAWVLS